MVSFIAEAGVINSDVGDSSATESCVCPRNGADCPGCVRGGRMFCQVMATYVWRGTHLLLQLLEVLIRGIRGIIECETPRG